MTIQVEPFIRLTTDVSGQFQEILTPEALEFVGDLDRNLDWISNESYRRRHNRQKKELDSGEMPYFIPDTEHLRNDTWTVSPNPFDLQDRAPWKSRAPRRHKDGDQCFQFRRLDLHGGL